MERKKNKNRVTPRATASKEFFSRENLLHWLGKLAEHEALTYVAKAAHWLLFNITFIAPALVGFATAIVQFVEISLDYPVLQYLKTHTERVSIAAITLVVLTPVLRGIFSALWRKCSLWIKSFKNSQPSSAEALIQATGINAFSPHFLRSERLADWKNCNEKIKSNKTIDLRIMGATGWNTFGDSKAPLYRLLSQFTGEVKILLMKPDPTLPALIQRATEVGKTAEQYVTEINNSISRLKQLKRNGKNISLKLYSQTPIWKMIISNDYMWLQHYCKSKNVEESPVYVFFSDGDGGTSLFHALYSVWLKRWDMDNNESCDLKN